MTITEQAVAVEFEARFDRKCPTAFARRIVQIVRAKKPTAEMVRMDVIREELDELEKALGPLGALGDILGPENAPVACTGLTSL